MGICVIDADLTNSWTQLTSWCIKTSWCKVRFV